MMTCHHTNLNSLEPVYLMTPTGRKVVGHIKLCGGVVNTEYGWTSCYKVLGPLKRGVGGSVITDVAWSQWLEMKKGPPIYFKRVGEKVFPDGYKGPAPVKEVQREPEPVELEEPYDA